MTIFETIMQNAFARLTSTTPARLILALDSGVANIRRTHLVAVPRENAPTVHHIDGDDDPRTVKTENRGCTSRECNWRIAIFVRPDDDNGSSLADPIIEEIVRRLDPNTTPYPYGTSNASARVELGAVRRETEIADADALRVDLYFRASYETGRFTLSP